METRAIFLLMSVVTFLAFMTVRVSGHLCITDPPQRLQNGNKLYVDCYQYTNPPCGKDFPDKPTSPPKEYRSGSVSPISLYMPVRHYYPDQGPGSFEINIRRDGQQNFTKLGKWDDGPEETRVLEVKMPEQAGDYLLQVIYTAPGYEFLSCSDVVVRSNDVDNRQTQAATRRPPTVPPTSVLPADSAVQESQGPSTVPSLGDDDDAITITNYPDDSNNNGGKIMITDDEKSATTGTAGGDRRAITAMGDGKDSGGGVVQGDGAPLSDGEPGEYDRNGIVRRGCDGVVWLVTFGLMMYFNIF